MHSTVLGKSNLKVTRIGLGLAALGRPGYITLGHAQDLAGDYNEAAMEAHAHEVLDAAWREGIRYFDTTRSYGLGEKFLGSWLRARKIATSNVTVGSKWGYTYTAGWKVKAEAHEIKEHSFPVLRRQWQESKRFLNDWLGLYQIHSATLDSGVLENREVLNELARLKSEGVKIGLSLSGAEQAVTLRKAMDVKVDGVTLFDAVQATWNLLETSANSALAEARNAGMGVIIKEALANGRLTARNHEAAFATKLALLQSEAQRLGITVDAIAISACLAQPFVDVVLSGATTIEQLISNVQAERVVLDTRAMESLQTLAEPPAVYWSTRKSLEWN